MKTSSAPDPSQPLKRSTAVNCALINQLATPGLGSIMAGRVVPGLGQIALALLGFLLVTAWFAQLFYQLYQQIKDLPPQPKPYPWTGKIGVLLFLAAWLWALFTSLSLLRQTHKPNPPPLQP